jgi:hypothetical protein
VRRTREIVSSRVSATITQVESQFVQGPQCDGLGGGAGASIAATGLTFEVDVIPKGDFERQIMSLVAVMQRHRC